jgi:hypothetical protein
MNDAVPHQLKVLVERAVRPLWATTARKRRMREDLLAHLTAIFEEEAAKLCDERAALDRAAERFGDPVELSCELQRSVPWWDCLRSMLEPLSLRPGESRRRLAGRIARVAAIVLIIVWVSIDLGFVSGLSLMSGVLKVLYTVFLAVAMAAVAFRVYSALRMGMYRAMKQRRRRLLWFYVSLSLPVTPILILLWDWANTGDLKHSLMQIGSACYLAPVITLLLLLTARSLTDPVRHDEDWADLRVEQ